MTATVTTLLGDTFLWTWGKEAPTVAASVTADREEEVSEEPLGTGGDLVEPVFLLRSRTPEAKAMSAVCSELSPGLWQFVARALRDGSTDLARLTVNQAFREYGSELSERYMFVTNGGFLGLGGRRPSSLRLHSILPLYTTQAEGYGMVLHEFSLSGLRIRATFRAASPVRPWRSPAGEDYVPCVTFAWNEGGTSIPTWRPGVLRQNRPGTSALYQRIERRRLRHGANAQRALARSAAAAFEEAGESWPYYRSRLDIISNTLSPDPIGVLERTFKRMGIPEARLVRILGGTSVPLYRHEVPEEGYPLFPYFEAVLSYEETLRGRYDDTLPFLAGRILSTRMGT